MSEGMVGVKPTTTTRVEVVTIDEKSMFFHQEFASGKLADGTEFQIIQKLGSGELIFRAKGRDMVVLSLNAFAEMAIAVLGLNEGENEA